MEKFLFESFESPLEGRQQYTDLRVRVKR